MKLKTKIALLLQILLLNNIKYNLLSSTVLATLYSGEKFLRIENLFLSFENDLWLIVC
jgi:hypothetical protein